MTDPSKPPHVEHLEDVIRAGQEWRENLDDFEVALPPFWKQGWFWGAVGAVLALATLVVVVLSALGHIG